MQRRRFPIRVKLTIATLLPLLIAILICSLLGFSILIARIGSQAQEKVRNDLNAAREIYLNEIDHVRDVVKFTAGASYTAEALSGKSRREIAEILVPLLQSEQLHVITAVDAAGTVLFRARNPEVYGDDRSRDFLVKRALVGELTAGTAVFSAQQLAMEGEDLAGQAKVAAVLTPHATPLRAAVEDSGMLLMASAPIRDRSGTVVGALYGGVLLNNNNDLVDRIKKVVYEGVKHEGKDVGGATIFLNDLRIATNIMDTENRRAIGTKLSEEVYDKVVLKKEKWVGRAFVVNDWYFSAYEPIISLEGAPVGALYVGMLEKPYTRLRFTMSLLVGGVLMLGSLMGIFVSRVASSKLARPIKELESLARRVAAGERGVRIESGSNDEIGDLGEEFNRMSAALTLQEEEIRGLNRDLEHKVLLRTAELEEKNRLLIQTQQELLRVEKLAAIGELAAGVAHEINNPLAIIRGNAELLQTALPESSPSQEEIGIITRQVGRVERIVANLLRFARREHKVIGRAAINGILDEIVGQVGHQIPLTGITVEKQYRSGYLEIDADADQLRQVFTNLVLNAIQAMPEGGILTVSSRAMPAEGMCEVTVADTGAGIAAEQMGQIFNPFFTTRADGTGLGLSVSYGIVKDHGGDIVVESSPGVGTLFRVTLPLA